MTNQTQYQQNIDIIKNFFRKPIVLLSGIFMLLAAVVSGLTDAMSQITYSDFIREFVKEALVSAGLSDTIKQLGLSMSNDIYYYISLNIFTVFLGVILIRLFSASRKNNNKIVKVAKLLKVFFLVELILCFAFITFYFCSTLTFTVHSSAYSLGGIMNFALNMIIAIFIYMCCFSKLNFSKAVVKSVCSIYLSNTNATLLGILSFISAGIYIIYPFWAFVYLKDIWFLSSALLVSVSKIIFGLMAYQYGKYIKIISSGCEIYTATEEDKDEIPVNEEIQSEVNIPKESQAEVKQPEINYYDIELAEDIQSKPSEENQVEEPSPVNKYICSNCGNPIECDDIYCNLCGNRVK